MNELQVDRATPGKQSETRVGRHNVQTMSKSEDRYPNDRVNWFETAFRKRQGASHYGQADETDRRRHHEAMLDVPSAERKAANDHCQREADFMNDRLTEKATR